MLTIKLPQEINTLAHRHLIVTSAKPVDNKPVNLVDLIFAKGMKEFPIDMPEDKHFPLQISYRACQDNTELIIKDFEIEKPESESKSEVDTKQSQPLRQGAFASVSSRASATDIKIPIQPEPAD